MVNWFGFTLLMAGVIVSVNYLDKFDGGEPGSAAPTEIVQAGDDGAEAGAGSENGRIVQP